MRGAVADPPPPALSLASGLPASFFGNDLTADLVAAFDEVLAPIMTTLDDLAAYFDPRYAPDDCLVWLGGWINTLIDARWSADRVRRHLPDLLLALISRGTVEGIEAGVRACTGHQPTVTDNGGVGWSERPQGSPPGRPGARLEIRVRLPDEDAETVRSLVHAVVADLKPAHVAVSIQLD